MCCQSFYLFYGCMSKVWQAWEPINALGSCSQLSPCWFPDTITGALDSTCTMSNEYGTQHELWLNLQPHRKHAQLSSCFFWLSLNTVSLPGDEVVQGGSCKSGCTSSLLLENWIVHGPCLIGVKNTMSHGFTYNHTQDMISCHHCSDWDWKGYLYQLTKWSNEVLDADMDMISHCCRSVEWYMNHVWQLDYKQWVTASLVTTPQICSVIIRMVSYHHSLKTAPSPGDEVYIQWSCKSGSAMPLLWENSMVYGPCKTCVGCQTHHESWLRHAHISSWFLDQNWIWLLHKVRNWSIQVYTGLDSGYATPLVQYYCYWMVHELCTALVVQTMSHAKTLISSFIIITRVINPMM